MFTRTSARLVAGALTVVAALAGAGTAHAEQADFTEKFHDQVSDQELFFSELCGFDVWFEVDARGRVRFWDDGRIHAQDHGTFSLINPENGKSLTRFWAGQFRGQGTETIDEDAGTLTITFEERYNGVHEKWLDPDGGVLVMDRGDAMITGEIVIDLATGEELHVHLDFSTHGPHPILEGGLDPSLACSFLA